MERISTILAAGLAGGIVFLVTLYALRIFKITTANPIHTLGSAFSARHGSQAALGLCIFFSGAFVFAFTHSFLLGFFPGGNFYKLAFVGAFIGFAHGLVVTLATANIVAKQHPLPEYQTLPFPAALSYVIGHVLFGITVGLAVAVTA